MSVDSPGAAPLGGGRCASRTDSRAAGVAIAESAARRAAPRLLAALATLAAVCSCAPDPLTIVALNLLHGLSDEDPAAEPFDRFGERMPRVLEVLAALRPDAVLFQEAYLSTAGGYPDLGRAVLTQMNPLGDGAGTYRYAFGDLFGSPAVENGAEAGLGQLTLARSAFTDLANHQVVSVAALRPRTVLFARLSSEQGPLALFNAHLQGPDDPDLAAQEMDDVLAFVEATAAPQESVVLAGDFNTLDTAAVLQRLRDAGFTDACAAAGLTCGADDRSGCTNSTLPLGDAGVRAAVRIDYTWVRGARVAAVDCAPMFDQPFELGAGDVLWASDHVGLAVDLELRSESLR